MPSCPRESSAWTSSASSLAASVRRPTDKPILTSCCLEFHEPMYPFCGLDPVQFCNSLPSSAISRPISLPSSSHCQLTDSLSLSSCCVRSCTSVVSSSLLFLQTSSCCFSDSLLVFSDWHPSCSVCPLLNSRRRLFCSLSLPIPFSLPCHVSRSVHSSWRPPPSPHQHKPYHLL